MLLLAATILLTTMSLQARAQTAAPPELIAKVPFSFHVNNVTLPAGTYRVSIINPSSDRSVLRLRGESGESLLISTASMIGQIRDDARLVFRSYGDERYFAEAWLPANEVGLAAPTTRAEKQQQKLSRADAKRETVALGRAKQN
jgi:hypothetical protein